MPKLNLNIFKKKIELTNEQKLSASKQKIEKSFVMFKEIHTAIEEENETLQQIVADEEAQIEAILKEKEELIRKSTLNKDSALDHLTANKALQEQVQKFIL